MLKQFECIPIEDYYLVVTDEYIKDGRENFWTYDHLNHKPLHIEYIKYFGSGRGSVENGRASFKTFDGFSSGTSHKEIIATIGRRIEGIPLIEIPDEDAANIFARQQLKGKVLDNPQRYKDLYDGYKAAQSKGTYTEEDMRNLFYTAVQLGTNQQLNIQSGKSLIDEEEFLRKLLQKKKVIKAVVLEIEKHHIGGGFGLAHSQPLQTTIKLLITNTETNTITPKEIIYE